MDHKCLIFLEHLNIFVACERDNTINKLELRTLTIKGLQKAIKDTDSSESEEIRDDKCPVITGDNHQ